MLNWNLEKALKHQVILIEGAEEALRREVLDAGVSNHAEVQIINSGFVIRPHASLQFRKRDRRSALPSGEMRS